VSHSLKISVVVKTHKSFFRSSIFDASFAFITFFASLLLALYFTFFACYAPLLLSILRYEGNNAGAKFGTGYCDAQCPHDIKYINGKKKTLFPLKLHS